MNPLCVDVAVLGGGFGGSLMTLLLDRIGLSVALVEQGSHPRFAIGESSTPVADLVLLDLAHDYDLPRLAPLAKYGPWKRSYPDVVCGLKRGFSYFQHQPDRPFQPSERHHNELLVAASIDAEHGDTHWLRADVDHFLFEEARRGKAHVFDRTRVSLSAGGQSWRISARRDERDFEIEARFVIDAAGGAGVVARSLGIPVSAASLQTNSRTVFGHFADLTPWHDVLRDAGAHLQDHPFYCDYAALHQLFVEGWMWQLRFDNGITSAGFAIDNAEYPAQIGGSVSSEWEFMLSRYPSLAQQFAGSRLVPPFKNLWTMGRMQRLAARAAGENWALLPSAAGFIDPLHSSGIAHTLCGIERLARLLDEHWQSPRLATELAAYDRRVHQEFELIDLMVHGCYATRRNFRLFAAFAMSYFICATTYERRRLHQGVREGFLCADDSELADVVKALWRLRPDQDSASDREIDEFELEVAQRLEPYNNAGLCDPQVRNMYARTALPVAAD